MVLLAFYVSVGRMLVSNLGDYQAGILQELNARVPFTIEAERVSGEWHSFTPVLVLSGLRLSVANSSEPPLVLSEGRIGVDVLNSLRTRSLQMTRVALDDLSLRGELTAQGQFKITGFDGGGQIGEWLQEFLLNVELVALRDNQLNVSLPNGEVRNLDLDLLLTRDGSHRRVEASLVSARGTDISVLAEGVGDPFQPQLFTGELYLDIESRDLGAVKDMLANGPPGVWAEGALDLELWLAWSKGKPTVETRIAARDLHVTDRADSWQVLLDRVALEARLLRRKNRWTLFASGLEVEKNGEMLVLPRLQLDNWDDALRLRATGVAMAPLSNIAAALEAAPAAMADVLSVLQPRGELASLQLSIGDLGNPVADWEVEANFDGVAVESWKGAPGVTAASGYLHTAPGGGFVVLDSQQLTMDFPTIYREPLHYDDFFGTINIDWDAQDLKLSSGLVTAQGEEGRTRVLFGLNIPLQPSDIGLEMDLLVGLEKAHPIHRNKYVPYVLNEALHSWLSDSIGDGLIEQGAFLWRGALGRNMVPLRTIQLAFNVADTSLDYHPDWPPVTVSDGIVLIDDSDVSVWVDRARLFESRVEHLSVETWLNTAGHIMLAVDGSVQGPAADGLAVLNESALANIVGSAFADWKLTGELSTDLLLQMNLTDAAVPPRVEVATRWRDVGLDIIPGNLPVRGLNGEFIYSTTQGFAATDLVGELWGQAVTATVGQQHPAGRTAYDPASSVVEVAIDTRVDMADLQRWLNLESLAFARGQTAAAIKVRVPPRQPPLLTVNSALAGVSLDLPAPWRKPEEDRRVFHLETPLGAGGNRLALSLGEELKLNLHVEEGSLRAGALGIAVEPATLRPGVLHISGNAPLMEADEWMNFVADYFTGGSVFEGEVPATPETLQPESTVAGPAVAREQQLAIVIDRLQTQRLVIWGQSVPDVSFSLAIEPLLWRLDLDTGWLRGELLLSQDATVSQLDIRHLDLSGLDQLDLVFDDSQQVLNLPDIDVTLQEIYQADRRVGNLTFDLRSREGILSAANITGEIATMTLQAQRPGQLLWRQGEDSQTELQAALHFEDLGQTLGYFGYQEIVETRSGEFDFDLRWPRSPQGFSLQEAQGSVMVKIGPGSFLEAPSGATGALRVVSILNLADIVRRLSLTHMFESGIPFDSVDGEVFMHGGTIEVAQMDVKGGSSFQFSGVSDVAAQSLEGELVATLPVANNLPWMAALAASIPVAAGVFVVSKVFNKQMNRLSSAVYSIGGTWDDPQVEFDHIFDAPRRRVKSGVSAGAEDTTPAREAPAASAPLPSPVPDPQTPVQSVFP